MTIARSLFFLFFSTLTILHTQGQAITNDATKRITQDVHRLVNEYRTSKGLKALAMRSKLNEIAMQHSMDMANGRVDFSHQGFQGRSKLIREYANYPCSVAENLYATTYTNITQISADAVKGWISSSGHRKNMVGNYIFTGIAVAKSRDGEYFITQLFVGK